MADVKYIENPYGFLVDTGLLFEINRLVLHPYGLAMAIEEGASSIEATIGLWDCRDDDEGVLFGAKSFEQGKAKLEKFRQGRGNDITGRRWRKLGFIVQEDANV